MDGPDGQRSKSRRANGKRAIVAYLRIHFYQDHRIDFMSDRSFKFSFCNAMREIRWNDRLAAQIRIPFRRAISSMHVSILRLGDRIIEIAYPRLGT
jgi:hypothetical protein